MEVVVASALLVVVLSVFGSLYAVVKRSTNVSQAMGAGTDQLSLALANLDAQVRSAYWTSQGTMNCKDSTGATISCTVIKVLTTYQSTPNAPRCWVWAITPLPKSGLGGPDTDPHHRFGRLQSWSYDPAPPWGSPEWTVEVDSLDFLASSLALAGKRSVLDPVTGSLIPDRYSGLAATISVAQNDTRRIVTSFEVFGRDALRSAADVPSGTYSCPKP